MRPKTELVNEVELPPVMDTFAHDGDVIKIRYTGTWGILCRNYFNSLAPTGGAYRCVKGVSKGNETGHWQRYPTAK